MNQTPLFHFITTTSDTFDGTVSFAVAFPLASIESIHQFTPTTTTVCVRGDRVYRSPEPLDALVNRFNALVNRFNALVKDPVP